MQSTNMKLRYILVFLLAMVIISGCLGGPQDPETPQPDNELPQQIQTSLEQLIQDSEENLSKQSGTYVAEETYNFFFDNDTVEIKVNYQSGEKRYIYYPGGNVSYVRSETSDSTSLMESPPLNYTRSYELIEGDVNTSNVELDVQKVNSNVYEGKYTYEGATGDVKVILSQDRVLEGITLNQSESIETDLNFRMQNDINQTLSEPSWVQEIKQRGLDPDEIEEVTGEVNFRKVGDNTLEVELVELNGADRAIVVSDTGAVTFPEGNTLTPGSTIQVTNVSVGEPILVRGVKENGNTWSIDLHIME